MTQDYKKTFRFLTVLALAYGLFAPSVFAQAVAPRKVSSESPTPGAETLQPVKLENLIQEALEKNPDIRAAKAEWKATKKRILQSWALPDPMVGMDIMGEMTETRVGPQDNRFMVSQMIPFPLKLWQQRKAAKAEAEAKHQEYLAVERDILNLLKTEFYTLYLADASLNVINEVHEILKKFESVSQSRYANRSGEQRDVAKAQAEVALTLGELYRLRQERETAVARLNAILDHDPFSDFGEIKKPELREVKKTLVELVNEGIQHRQEILAKEAEVKKAKIERTLARLQNIPDVEVGFTYTWVGGGMTESPEDGKDSWMFPLKINVPIWQNRILSSISEAKYEMQAAEASLEVSHNQIFYEVRDAYSRLQAASKIAMLYETAIIPQAKLALSSDQAGYEGGKVDFLNLLDSERVYLNAQLSSIQIYAEALKSYADLERAVGISQEESL